jgi:acyl carrier protein
MTRIEEQLITIAQQELGIDPGQITTASRLSDYGDSLDWLNLILAVEKAFDIEISDEQSLSIRTVGDLVELLKQPSVA